MGKSVTSLLSTECGVSQQVPMAMWARSADLLREDLYTWRTLLENTK